MQDTIQNIHSYAGTNLRNYFQYASYLFNGLILFFWFKNRIIQNRFLAGRWEGTLICSEYNYIVFDCILIITRHDTKDNKACFHYQKKSLHTGKILIKGVDQLVDYKSDVLFARHKKWTPRFIRELHHYPQKKNSTDMEQVVMPAQYEWDCFMSSFWLTSKMDVIIKGTDINFKGALQKV